MALVTISLPALQLRSRRDDLEVTIRGFLVLALPETLLGTDSLPVVSTIDDLENLVTEQQAWINRVGPCLLRFSSSTSSQLSHIGLSEHETRACILGSPVWEQLGLRVVDAEEDAENVVFSLQHPNLSSSLLPPKGALTVELEEVCVALDFSRTTQTKSHRRNRATGSGITSQEHQLSNGCGGAQGVNSEDLQAIEDFLSQAGIGTRERASASSSTPRRSYDRLEHCTLPKSEGNCPTLMQSAINVLLFGKQKRHVGVKWVDGEDWDGLVQLAPAVFHVPYLETVIQRVKYMPAMAMSLARMVDAESPSLRKLATSFEKIHLGTQNDLGNESQSGTRDVVSGMEQSIWRTLLKQIAVPKVAASGTKRRQHDSLTREESQMTTSTPLTFDCSRTMDFSVDSGLQVNSHVPVDILQMGDGFYHEQEGPTLKLTTEGDHCLRSSEQAQSFHEELPFTNQYQESTISNILTLDYPVSHEPDEGLATAFDEPLLTLEQNIWETCAEVQDIDHGEEFWHDGTPTLIFGAAGQFN